MALDRPFLLVDLDGTVLDTAPGITRCIRATLAEMDVAPPEGDDLRWCIGPPFHEWFPQLLNSKHPDRLETAVSTYRTHYGEQTPGSATGGMFEAQPFDDVERVLRDLQEAGARLWIVTSKAQPFAARLVAHFGLADLFERVYGPAPDAHIHDKYDLIREVLIEQRVPVHQCVMIGDRASDILAARRNGMASIAVLWGYGTEAELTRARPDAVAATPQDLLDHLA